MTEYIVIFDFDGETRRVNVTGDKLEETKAELESNKKVAAYTVYTLAQVGEPYQRPEPVAPVEVEAAPAE